MYGTITAIERAFDKVVPCIPYYSSAYRLANQFVRPFLHKAHPHIDAALEYLQMYMKRPEMVAIAAAVHEVLSRIPILEWFVRGPDGRPLRPPRPPSGFITSR